MITGGWSWVQLALLLMSYGCALLGGLGAAFWLGNPWKHNRQEREMMNGWYCWKLWERALLETCLRDVWEHSATAPLPICPGEKA